MTQQILTGQVAFSPVTIQVKAEDPVEVEDLRPGVTDAVEGVDTVSITLGMPRSSARNG